MFSDDPEMDLALAIYIHDAIIEASGGARGLHNKHLIESALARPLATAFGVGQFRSAYARAAALLDAVANNHGFRDGNKRTAMALASFYLYQNDIRVSYTNQEYEDVMLWVVNEKPGVKKIASWLRSRSTTTVEAEE